MSASSLYPLAEDDIPKAVECLKDAFKDDPLWAEVFKDDPDRDKSLSGFYTCPLLYGIMFGKAYATSPEIEAVAVWVSGKYADMTMWRMLRCGAMAHGAKMGREAVRNLSILNKQLGPLRKRFMKNKPHVHLTIIGVSSAAQRMGHGSKLMDAVTEECDRDGTYLYLETEKEENVPFYEKHGLTVLEKTVIRKMNVPMWLMERKPQ